MRPLRAARSALALIAAFTALTGGAVRAQENDPFALDKGLTAHTVSSVVTGPVLSEIEIDGQVLSRMVMLDGRGEDVTIDAADARLSGLPLAPDARGQVPLKTLKIYKWTFDKLRQRVAIQLFRNNDGGNFRDLSRATRLSAASKPITALRLDYDLSASLQRGRVALGGLFQTSLVHGFFAVNSGFHAILQPGSGPATVRRLNSSAHLGIPLRKATVTVGDFVSATTTSQRAVRMGGLQIASNFKLRPDLITTPLPSFSGNVAVPTNVDLLIADRRFTVGDIEPGRFTLQNVPTGMGRGEFSVLMKDELGREVAQTMRFYTSPNLLAPGLGEFALNAGFVRRSFGQPDDRYGGFVTTAFYRRGFSPFLTAEASAEMTPGLVNAGARADFTLGNIALLSGEARLSRDSTEGNGHLLRFSSESTSERFGVSASFIVPSRSYRDAASHLGDGPPPRQVVGNFSYNFGRMGQALLAYVHDDVREDARYRIKGRVSDTVSASFRSKLSKRLDIAANAGMRTSEGRRSYFASFALGVQLGAASHAGTNVNLSTERNSITGNYAKEAVGLNDLGYQLAATQSGAETILSARATYRTLPANFEAQVQAYGSRIAAQVDAHGSLLLVGPKVYARANSDGSYALVRTGEVSDVAIKLDNRPVGKTNAKGLLLVENILALTPMRIDVDDTKLPQDAVLGRANHIISVPSRAISVVDIDVVAFRPVMRQVVRSDGRELDAGESVVSLPSGKRTMMGYDGLIELNAFSKDRTLEIGTPDRRCIIELPAREALEKGDTGLVCRVQSIAANDNSPPLAGQKVALRN